MPGRRLPGYSLLAVLGSGFGLAAFVGLSVWAGLMRSRGAESYSLIPGYLDRGVVGWAVLLVLALGLLSPLALAVREARRS